MTAELPAHYEEELAMVRKATVGPYGNNVFLFACKTTGKAVLIDAADDISALENAAEDLDVVKVLTTHGHWDHIQAVDAAREAFGAPVGIHEDDAGMLGSKPDFVIEDSELIGVGDLELEALHTPGHTAGSLCFRWGRLLFSGDTLFPGGPGATHGNKAAFDTIIGSIRTRLFTLDDETMVMPGHGDDTTIGAERPHLDEWIARGW